MKSWLIYISHPLPLPLLSQLTADIFKGKRKRNVVDIDGPKFRTERYDPSYGWSIWANERKLEVTATHLDLTLSYVHIAQPEERREDKTRQHLMCLF